MSNQPLDGKQTTTDQILDLLLDALLERSAARRAQLGTAPPPPQPAPPLPSAPRVEPAPRQPPAPPPSARTATPPPAVKPHREAKPGEEGWEPPPKLPPINLGKTLVRLIALVAALVVVVNIPVTRYGVSLARIMPDSASLIIRNGLVLKGSGPEIYRLEDNKLRWISSLDAFEHLGLTWDDVHVVDDKFLVGFEKGPAIHVLLKCQTSPHIYRLENQQKRWIKDIDTFMAEGHVWEDVRFVSCQYLRDLPDGPPIPEDAGEPPQP